jgi:hypothetical protein
MLGVTGRVELGRLARPIFWESLGKRGGCFRKGRNAREERRKGTTQRKGPMT